jgi:hypothetical protein
MLLPGHRLTQVQGESVSQNTPRDEIRAIHEELSPLADHKMTDLAALLPWNWRRPLPVDRAA